MKIRFLCIVTAAWAILASLAYAAPPMQIGSVFSNLSDYPNGDVPLYEILELAFEYDTPLPFEAIVDGFFFTPDDDIIVQPAFWDGDLWKIRFTPSELGTYSYFVRAEGNDSSTQTFNVVPSVHKGFVRTNGEHFAFDNGERFVGVGLNVPWSNNYDGYMVQPINLMRKWMTNSGINQTWILSIQDSVLGDNYNLEDAREMDRIVNLAKRNGVYLILTLDDVNQYAYNWWQNLYNVDNDGPCEYRLQIFTDPVARVFQERIFRYIIARWGYSTHILSWEFFNEIDELRWSDQDHWNYQELEDWHQDLGQYVRNIDAHNHVVNTSTGSYKVWPSLYAEMDFAQIHYYYVPTVDYAYINSDTTAMASHYARLVRDSAGGKPSIIGEYGITGDNWGISGLLPLDITGVHTHNTLWASLMSGMATTGLSWHWNDHNDAWWQHYVAIGEYFEGVGFTSPLNVTADGVRALALSEGDNTYVWIQNLAHTWYNVVTDVPMGLANGTVSIPLLVGEYQVEWWSTYQGGVIRSQQVSSDGTLLIGVIDLETDVAIKIERKEMDAEEWIYLPLVMGG